MVSVGNLDDVQQFQGKDIENRKSPDVLNIPNSYTLNTKPSLNTQGSGFSYGIQERCSNASLIGSMLNTPDHLSPSNRSNSQITAKCEEEVNFENDLVNCEDLVVVNREVSKAGCLVYILNLQLVNEFLKIDNDVSYREPFLGGNANNNNEILFFKSGDKALQEKKMFSDLLKVDNLAKSYPVIK